MGGSSSSSSSSSAATPNVPSQQPEQPPPCDLVRKTTPLASSPGSPSSDENPIITELRVAVVGFSWRFLSDSAFLDMRKGGEGRQPFNAGGISPLISTCIGPPEPPAPQTDYYDGGGGPPVTYDGLRLSDKETGTSRCQKLWDYCLDEMQGRLGAIPKVEPPEGVYLTKLDTLNHEAFVFWYEEGNAKSWAFLKNTLQYTVLPQRQQNVTRREHKCQYGDVSIIDHGWEDSNYVPFSQVPIVIVSVRCAPMRAAYKYKPMAAGRGIKEARNCAKALDCPFFKVDLADREGALNVFRELYTECKRLGFKKSGRLANCTADWELEAITGEPPQWP
ncbi:hypothetical protein Pelo_3038 [Pelomyxa schiedti]|nr:hypothetical protein Pelo_3038 [Pelomyxa schiedti]